ncbi:MAG: nucleotide pyrophosphohydrolase [Bacteroidota bacterium]
MINDKNIIDSILKFRDERDWSQFHNPKDLAIALSIESSELLELFLWKKSQEADIVKVKDELADIFTYAILLADHYNFDIDEIVLRKLKQNELKYPIEKARGTSKKYNEL